MHRHHALRTRFVKDGEDVWWQEVTAARPLRLRVDDLSRLDPERRAARADKVCRELAATPIDITRTTLAPPRLLRIAEDEWELMFVLHHICADGWSHSLLISELAELYKAAASGTAHTLRVPSAQPTDYARHQLEARDPDTEARRATYCATYLKGFPSGSMSPRTVPGRRSSAVTAARCAAWAPVNSARSWRSSRPTGA